MRKEIKADLYRYFPRPYSLKVLLKGFRVPGFFYMYLLRMASIYPKFSVRGLFFRILHRRYTFKFGFQIPVSTRIGGGFYIGHFGNVVISPRAVIGENCNIAHGVTIGAIMKGKNAGAPVIGNNVWMGTNSIIVGGITIESNALIAPGAFVNFDVPSNSIVIGNPGKIIKKNNPCSNYIQNTI